MTAIVTMILTRAKEHLQWAMIDETPEDDPIRIDEVQVGRYKKGPNENPKRLWVQSGDIEDPNYLDSIASYSKNEKSNRLAFYVPSREIGGGEMWYRRGMVGIELFFQYVEDAPDDITANEIAYDLQAKLMAELSHMKVSDLTDDYGESAIKVFVYSTALFQGGGQDSSIWRGKVLFEVLTNRLPVQH